LSDDRIRNKNDMDQEDGAHRARWAAPPQDSTTSFSEVSTVVRLTGRATGSYAHAALPKPIRLFDKVT